MALTPDIGVDLGLPAPFRAVDTVVIMTPSSEPIRTAGVLFWLQIGVGVAGGVGFFVLLMSLARTQSPIVAASLPVWLGAIIAGLWVLERRKVSPPVSADAWARQVRELRDSRLEIVNAFEIERRRIERDLHDGAQQHLVAVSMKVGEAALLLEADEDPANVRSLIVQAQDASESALAALRRTVAGVHPAILSDLGLESAVRELAADSAIDVRVRVPHRLPAVPDAIAAAAYFLVSEALTNIAKYAPDAGASVLIGADDQLHVSVVDDGDGGATVQSGHGLAGMTERLAAFGGMLTVSSPTGGPTWVSARIPLLLPEGQAGVAVDGTHFQESHA